MVVLANHFIHQLCDDYGMPAKSLEKSVERAFVSYPWPGNIRELRNVIERCLILGGGMIGLTDLPPEISSCGMTESLKSDATEKVTGRTKAPNEGVELSNVELSQFTGSLRGASSVTSLVAASTSATGSLDPWHVFKAKSEREHILRAINLADGNMTEAARLLQVERQTMYKWIKTYNIER